MTLAAWRALPKPRGQWRVRARAAIAAVVAAEAYIEEHPELEGWDLAPRWVGGEDGQRDEIALTVPTADDAEVA